MFVVVDKKASPIFIFMTLLFLFFLRRSMIFLIRCFSNVKEFIHFDVYFVPIESKMLNSISIISNNFGISTLKKSRLSSFRRIKSKYLTIFHFTNSICSYKSHSIVYFSFFRSSAPSKMVTKNICINDKCYSCILRAWRSNNKISFKIENRFRLVIVCDSCVAVAQHTRGDKHRWLHCKSIVHWNFQ